MWKYLTIKDENKYYRIIKFEESATDGSIIIRHLWHLHAKITYHTNHGSMTPPYQTHYRGCAGNIIPESIDKRNKFITEYPNQFQTIGFSKLPKDRLILKPYSHDIILDVSNKKFSKYNIELFSYNRNDLLKRDFDNAVIVLIELRTHKLIAGCFDN